MVPEAGAWAGFVAKTPIGNHIAMVGTVRGREASDDGDVCKPEERPEYRPIGGPPSFDDEARGQ